MTLRVHHTIGLCTVQDLGRRGHMHEAVPPGGALVPERLIAANRAVGNPDDAPGFEILGQLSFHAEAHVEIASDVGPVGRVPPGGLIVQASEPRRAAYLAVRGGVAAPLVLGGRGTLLCGGLGGLIRAGQRYELAGLPPELELPRRTTPRTRVPAGSIAIAGLHTAVYPFDSPGGWHLIGSITGVQMFGPDGPLLHLGDRVRFVP